MHTGVGVGMQTKKIPINFSVLEEQHGAKTVASESAERVQV